MTILPIHETRGKKEEKRDSYSRRVFMQNNYFYIPIQKEKNPRVAINWSRKRDTQEFAAIALPITSCRDIGGEKIRNSLE